jgi:hypothetical protein
VLVLAAKLGPSRLRAVVANEPFLAPPSPLEDHHFPDVPRALRLLAACLSDRLRAALGLPPVYVRLAAPMSEKAVALVPLQDSDLAHFRTPGPARRYQGVSLGPFRWGGRRNCLAARWLLAPRREAAGGCKTLTPCPAPAGLEEQGAGAHGEACGGPSGARRPAAPAPACA